VHAHQVAALRASASLAAATALVLTASGGALFARCFWGGRLYGRVEGTSLRARLATLTALSTLTATTATAAAASIAAALATLARTTRRTLAIG